MSKLSDDFEEARLILNAREAELQAELRDHMAARDTELSQLIMESEEQLKLAVDIHSNAEEARENWTGISRCC
jgi:predicted Holliday junction resolvase-like endonuclease